MRTLAPHLARFKTLIVLLGVLLALSTYVHGSGQVMLAGMLLIAAGFALMLVHPPRLTTDAFKSTPLNAPPTPNNRPIPPEPPTLHKPPPPDNPPAPGEPSTPGEAPVRAKPPAPGEAPVRAKPPWLGEVPVRDEPTAPAEPRAVQAPVRGRWVPVHSPADKVPSHGVDAYGQTYAIDLVHHEDEEHDWSAVRAWPPARRAAAFSGFGRPVYAPADGEVVRVSGRHRDHWSRNSWFALPYMVVEGMLRELGGPGFILGNHVILDLGDGTYAAFAHLKRGSIKVRPGQRVRAGDHLADCGNSGNTSEPHLHFQLMDRARPMIANGVPFVFEHYETGGEHHRGVPGGQRPFTA
ncbi:peptidoglycan DD-metalloendopeptidase family protein [Spirillospora sp. NPDC048911]|uniref:M23 family metallopeptidase n=1 Tax=Spirillospora sp. NPDC048911 TaxID=3364527 RepID=UPI003722E3CD